MTYRYAECGLDYVHLKGGYRRENTDYGPGVAIEHADALDRAIAWTVITAHARLRGQEVRFLRTMLGKSQAELASRMGVKRLTVARWEAAPNTPIPGPADRLLRLETALALFGKETLHPILAMSEEITDDQPTPIVMAYRPKDARPATDGWKLEQAA